MIKTFKIFQNFYIEKKKLFNIKILKRKLNFFYFSKFLSFVIYFIFDFFRPQLKVFNN
jgi:hypothetical protein